ncbi:hypothetical protein Tco_0915196 [Tanacetum coccineum]
MSVVYLLITPIHEDGEKATMEQIRKRNKWDNDDYVCRGLILNAKYMAEDASSKKFLDSNKPKENNVAGPSADNMVEHNNSIRKPGHLKNDYKGGKVGNKAKFQHKWITENGYLLTH